MRASDSTAKLRLISAGNKTWALATRASMHHNFRRLSCLLLTLALFSCQAQAPMAQQAPAKGPWSVTFKLTRDSGKSYYSGASVKVGSDGVLENASWQNGIAGAEPRISKGTIGPEAVAAVAAALGDPELAALAEGSGPVELSWTVNGKTKTLRSISESFPGAGGKLLEALKKAAPLPALQRQPLREPRP